MNCINSSTSKIDVHNINLSNNLKNDSKFLSELFRKHSEMSMIAMPVTVPGRLGDDSFPIIRKASSNRKHVHLHSFDLLKLRIKPGCCSSDTARQMGLAEAIRNELIFPWDVLVQNELPE